jgi:1,4-alpha-glucan branching enzyme
MAGHPGKKLLFMGQEFGQQREWSEEREIDWYLLGTPLNQQLQDYVKALWKLVQKYPALHATDYDPNGFEWINADDSDRSTFSFVRKASDGKDNVLFVINFTPMVWKGFKVGVPFAGTYTHLLDSADPRFGGMGTGVPDKIKAQQGLCDYKDYSITFDLPPYAAEVFLFQDPSNKDTIVRSQRKERTLRTSKSEKAEESADSDPKASTSKAVKKTDEKKTATKKTSTSKSKD